MVKRHKVDKDTTSEDGILQTVGSALKNTFAPTPQVAQQRRAAVSLNPTATQIQQRRQAVADVFRPTSTTPIPTVTTPKTNLAHYSVWPGGSEWYVLS